MFLFSCIIIISTTSITIITITIITITIIIITTIITIIIIIIISSITITSIKYYRSRQDADHQQRLALAEADFSSVILI